MAELTHPIEPKLTQGIAVAALFICAIVIGAALGLSSPELGASLSDGIDPALLTMLFLLFFDVRLSAVTAALSNLRFIALAWGANFLVIPIIGYAIASLFLTGQPLLYTGLLIYFLAPCTDWVLSFTRMAKGDTALGAALLPINLVTQLLLFPLWVWVFAHQNTTVDFGTIPDTMLYWFVLPFAAAQVIRWGLEGLLSKSAFDRLCEAVGILIPLVTATLVLLIFAGNVVAITAHPAFFGIALVAIFFFFVATFILGEAITRLFKLKYKEQALLAMTTAARNAPLMLAVTALAIPDQPLIYAALIIGMLVEFPHLVLLKHVLLAKAAREEKLT